MNDSATQDALQTIHEFPETKETRAFWEIREAIRNGRHKPGSRLVIAEFARELGMSEIPIRAALQRLCGEGFAAFRPNTGYRVAVPPEVNTTEVGQVVAALWELSGRLAALNHTSADLATLRGLQADLVAASEARDLEAIGHISQTFHDVVAQASGNAYLLQVLREAQMHSRGPTFLLHVEPATAARRIRDHDSIIDAIAAREADAAASLMRWHATNVSYVAAQNT